VLTAMRRAAMLPACLSLLACHRPSAGVLERELLPERADMNSAGSGPV